MLSDTAPEHERRGAVAVVEHRAGLAGERRRFVPAVLAPRERRRSKIRRGFRAEAIVGGRAHIFAHCPRQPEKIVAAVGAHALVGLAAGRMVPVLHVALRVLVGAARKDVRSRARGVDGQEIDAVLQLIPEADRAAALVEASSAQHAAAERGIRAPRRETAHALRHGGRILFAPHALRPPRLCLCQRFSGPRDVEQCGDIRRAEQQHRLFFQPERPGQRREAAAESAGVFAAEEARVRSG